ncbi:hypothetical protein EE612_030524 [Oryza sativa]|nr:hypothetical protein EE612_030524 [Oryza sativa]
MRRQRGGGMLRWDERQWQLGGGALPSRLSLAIRGRRRRQRQSRPPLCQIRGGRPGGGRGGAVQWRRKGGGMRRQDKRRWRPGGGSLPPSDLAKCFLKDLCEMICVMFFNVS